MACTIKTVQGVKAASDCKCYGAVMRTYAGMSSEPDHVACEAALRVYRYHHPEDPIDKAALTVESWVYAGEQRNCH